MYSNNNSAVELNQDQKIQKRRKKSSTISRRKYYGLLFILPFFILLGIFIVYPIAYSIFLSFHKWDGSILAPQFVGLDNYVALFRDKFFYKSIFNTWLIWGVSFIPQLLLAIGLAVILSNFDIKGKGFFRWVYFLPVLVTMSSIANLVFFIMDWKTGILNQILMSLGVIQEQIQWLEKIPIARLTISVTLCWMWFGFTMVIFMAGIKAIPLEYYEAGLVDGTNKWQEFWYITLPCLRPSITYNIVTSIIGGLTLYDVPAVISASGAPQSTTLTMVMYLYNLGFRNYNMGYAATIAMGLFVMVMFFVAIAYSMLMRNTQQD
ncbi:MAG TPA: sugar ABC transporter permease [Defluviitaleaceae bacterium]|jgi:multiple sugar transport system permease protein|nr:sugar ABC transporter permease [Defluviitaleaceae bacterium]